MSTAKIGQ